MTIQERMIPRTEREKDLLKYGRSQERERIIKLLEEHSHWKEMWAFGPTHFQKVLIALIKGEK